MERDSSSERRSEILERLIADALANHNSQDIIEDDEGNVEAYIALDAAN